MGNKRFDYYCAYIDPDEIKLKTPAKRLYSVWPVIQATTVSRASTIFWKEVLADEGWGKKDIVLIGVMPGGLTPDMKKDYVAPADLDDEDEEEVEEVEEETVLEIEDDEDDDEFEDEEDEEDE